MCALKAAIVPVTAFQQNCAILWDETSLRATVVDPGGDVSRILEAIEQFGVTVETILLTHGHIDHAGGAAALRDALAARQDKDTPVPLEGPDQRDRFLLEGLEEQGRAYGFEGVRNAQPDRWLEEGMEVMVAGEPFKVLHCPGHTPGHLVFVNEVLRFAIVGDVLFRGSVGRTDFAYGDPEALIRAIREKLFPLGDDIVFLCGHGPGSTFGDERRDNPFAGDGAGKG